MRRFMLPSLAIAVALAASCTAGVRYSASSDGYGPDLVYAAPGVQVIADYDQPIFFADGYYWRLDGDRWYRSSNHTGGWAYAEPPPAVRRIERPRDYVHYRPQGWVAHNTRGQQPSGRDRREERPRVESRQPIQAPPQRREEQRQAPPRAAPPSYAPPRRQDNRGHQDNRAHQDNRDHH